jgi:hypothetical protein
MSLFILTFANRGTNPRANHGPAAVIENHMAQALKGRTMARGLEGLTESDREIADYYIQDHANTSVKSAGSRGC